MSEAQTEAAQPVKKLTRRDFLKLSGVAAAALVALRYGRFSPRLENAPAPEDSINVFSIDKDITGAEIETFTEMFEKIARGMDLWKNNPEPVLTDEYKIIDAFDSKTFKENTTNYLNRMVRLQRVYRKFDTDLDMDTNIRWEAKELISDNFNTLAIPMSIFHKASCDYSDASEAELVKILLLNARELIDDAPVDPLLGMDIYGEPGMQIWFSDFDMKYENGKAVGTYPVTMRFLRESGNLFKDLESSTGPLYEKGNLPGQRPGSFRFGAEQNLEAEYKRISVDADVKQEIYEELDRYGIDRAISTLAIRSDPDNPELGGFVDPAFSEVNILIGRNKLDMAYYRENKEVLLYAIKHEIFHVLVNKIKEMSDFDAYLTWAKLNLMYRKSSHLFSSRDILNEAHLPTTQHTTNLAYHTEALQFFNEAYRNRYVNNIDITESIYLQGKIFQIYTSELYRYTNFLKSDLFKVNFEIANGIEDYEKLADDERLLLARKSIEWTVNHMKYAYETQKDSMTNLEQFICSEIIQRSEDQGLFSELSFAQLGWCPSDYISMYLPGLLMYLSITHGDGKFLQAVAKDVQKQVDNGTISERKQQWVLRILGHIISWNKENNGSTLGRHAHEHLADQFAFSLTPKLGFDTQNLVSSLRSHMVIKGLKPKFRELLRFYIERNLAREKVHPPGELA